MAYIFQCDIARLDYAVPIFASNSWLNRCIPDFGLIFTFLFWKTVGPNGQKTLMTKSEFDARLAQRQSKPPTIQLDLLKAHSLKSRLLKSPGLTQTMLADELGIDRTSLIRTLSLVKLSPAIQEYIKQLEPDTRKGLPPNKKTTSAPNNPRSRSSRETV